VRRVILRRLELLRSSPEVRRRFVELVHDLWAAVSDDWRRHGRSAVEAMIAGRRELQRRGALWREVARTPHKPWHDAVLGLVNRLGPDGVVAVVPTYFAHIGFYLDLPGTVMLGLGAYTGHLGARERSEALARRLRSISDPTRLAMLESLRGEPGTVTELAERLSLAQPTVSNHVKVLREAELVGIEPGEGRRRLVVRPEAVRDLMLHLGEALDVPGFPVGEEGQPGQ
jgi:DNA-binding transcriptional ArsR family regulator